MNKLQQLKQFSTVVADTGDIEAIKKHQPLDATTNPSLLLKAAQLPQYQPLLQQARQYAQSLDNTGTEQQQLACDKFATLIGREITQIVKGRVSTEVDARLSFDTRASIEKARQLIALYESIGVDRSRIYIKLASTWEGIQAAKVLEQDNIQCNLTLLFSLEQAKACADIGATLISPFVGRIYDWHRQHGEHKDFTPEQDPGVQSVARIFEHYKSHGYNTIIMGASFRHTGQIEALAGCDKLTISPALMDELSIDKGPLAASLFDNGRDNKLATPAISEADFRWALNADNMACDKLAEGIRLFARDQEKLEQQLVTAATQT